MDKIGDKTPKKSKKLGTQAPLGISSPTLIKKKVKGESGKKKSSSSTKKEEKKKVHGTPKEHHSKSSSSQTSDDKPKIPDNFDMEVDARVAIMRSELDYLCDSMKSTISLELLKLPPQIRKMKAKDFFELYNGDLITALTSKDTNSIAQIKT